MTSTVTSNGQTIVPRDLRKRFKIASGTMLDWQEDGEAIRVVKLEKRKTNSFLKALKKLGQVPAAPRSKELVRYE